MKKIAILSLSALLVIGISAFQAPKKPKKAVKAVKKEAPKAKVVLSDKAYDVKFDRSFHDFGKATEGEQVETIFVKEGDFVKKGQALFQLENVNTKLSAANAAITALANDYQRNNEKLIDAKNAIELAQNRLTNDSLSLARQQELWSKNIGSKVELEQKELNFENAKVNLKKSEVTFKDLKRQLKLTSDQSKNNLQIAQSAKDNLIIKSEVEGYIYKINVKQGELATAIEPIAIVGKKNFIVEFNVDEFDIVKIEKGQKVIIRMDSYKNQTFEAKINFISPMMDKQTRSFRVEAFFNRVQWSWIKCKVS